MTFEVLPAIDVSGGRLARMIDGRVEPVAEHDGDPVLAARTFVSAGARWLHFVDIDMALGGEPMNLDVLARITGPGVRVQASGGIATRAAAIAAIGAGADRVVLGSAALHDLDALAALASELGEKLAVGLEIDDGSIRPRGNLSATFALEKTLEWLSTSPVRLLVVTAVGRVGGLGGPDLTSVRAALGTARPVLAAGGIASLNDLRALAEAGAAGAIVGRAALEGEIDLQVALQQAAEGR